jgi:alcohol dehydrogenase
MANAIEEARIPGAAKSTGTMRALVFHAPNRIAIEQVPIPKPEPGEAVIRVTLTTICGTDLHILKGEYPVKPGLIMFHARCEGH